MLKLINRILFGGTYKVVHICADTGKRKIFWCDTWQDALEWVACALNCDKVTVTDTTGFVVASRGKHLKSNSSMHRDIMKAKQNKPVQSRDRKQTRENKRYNG